MPRDKLFGKLYVTGSSFGTIPAGSFGPRIILLVLPFAIRRRPHGQYGTNGHGWKWENMQKNWMAWSPLVEQSRLEDCSVQEATQDGRETRGGPLQGEGGSHVAQSQDSYHESLALPRVRFAGCTWWLRRFHLLVRFMPIQGCKCGSPPVFVLNHIDQFGSVWICTLVVFPRNPRGARQT